MMDGFLLYADIVRLGVSSLVAVGLKIIKLPSYSWKENEYLGSQFVGQDIYH